MNRYPCGGDNPVLEVHVSVSYFMKLFALLGPNTFLWKNPLKMVSNTSIAISCVQNYFHFKTAPLLTPCRPPPPARPL